MAKKETLLAKASNEVPDWMKEYRGEGQEDIQPEDMRMPRLKLGQSLTQEVKDKLAEEGDMIHNITKEVICPAGQTIHVIPICYSKEYILWRDIKNGGGIFARARRVSDNGNIRFQWDKPGQVFEDKIGGTLKVKYETKKYIDEDGLGDWGSQISDDPDSKPAATAHYNYVFMLPNKEMIAVSLSKTSAKKAEELNTMMKLGEAPTFARIFELSTYIEPGDGTSFANYQFKPAGLVQDQDLFMELRSLHESLKEKGINVDYSDEGEAKSDNEGDEGRF